MGFLHVLERKKKTSLSLLKILSDVYLLPRFLPLHPSPCPSAGVAPHALRRRRQTASPKGDGKPLDLMVAKVPLVFQDSSEVSGVRDLPCRAGDGSSSPSVRSPNRDGDAWADACLEPSALPEDVLSQKMGKIQRKAGLLILNKAAPRSSPRQVL